MADLGIYNYIQAACARGETDAQITATLARNGLSQEAIDEALTAAKHGKAPVMNPKPVRTRSGHGFFWTFLFLLIAAGVAGYFMWSGRVSPPWQKPACATVDDCVRADVDKIAAEAATLYAASNNSYANLCADGVVNFSAASGTNQEIAIDPALRTTVNDVLQRRGANSQQQAGISCGSRIDRFFVSAAMPASSGYYCVDSRGVATTSAPNGGTGFCGSVLSNF